MTKLNQVIKISELFLSVKCKLPPEVILKFQLNSALILKKSLELNLTSK